MVCPVACSSSSRPTAGILGTRNTRCSSARWQRRFADVRLARTTQPETPDTVGHAPVTALTPFRPPAVLQTPILQTIFLAICVRPPQIANSQYQINSDQEDEIGYACEIARANELTANQQHSVVDALITTRAVGEVACHDAPLVCGIRCSVSAGQHAASQRCCVL